MFYVTAVKCLLRSSIDYIYSPAISDECNIDLHRLSCKTLESANVAAEHLRNVHAFGDGSPAAFDSTIKFEVSDHTGKVLKKYNSYN